MQHFGNDGVGLTLKALEMLFRIPFKCINEVLKSGWYSEIFFNRIYSKIQSALES